MDFKVGDKVIVIDTSYTMVVDSGGVRREVNSGIYRQKQEILAVGCDLPAEGFATKLQRNDTIIQDIKTKQITFIQARFLQAVPDNPTCTLTSDCKNYVPKADRPEPKYKIGDKVRGERTGDIYKIEGNPYWEGGEWRYPMPGRYGSDHIAEKTTRLLTPEPKFKVGDRVRVVIDEWISAPIGTTGLINKVEINDGPHRPYYMNKLWWRESDLELAKYDTKTAEALEESITGKWHDIRHEGVEDCPLCVLHYQKGGCSMKCPVKMKTGKDFCADTPYGAWRDHYHKEHDSYTAGMKVYCDECANCADAFTDFLISLRDLG